MDSLNLGPQLVQRLRNRAERENCSVQDLLAAWLDQTGEPPAAEALRESEARYRQLVELSPDPIVVYGQGKILHINRAGAKNLLGVDDPNEVIGRPVLDLVDPAERGRLGALIDEIEAGKPLLERIEERLIGPDGEIIHLDVSSAPITYQGKPARQVVLKDITDRKRAEQALRDSEARFRTVFEEGPVGIALVDQNLRMFRVNEAFCTMLAYPEEELVQMSFPDVTHPDDVEIDVSRARRLLRGEIAEYEIEKRYITKDNRIIWGHLTARTVRDQTGELLYAIGIVQDITARKLAEDEIRLHSTRAEALAQISHSLAEARLDYRKVLDTVAQHVAQRIGDACVIALLSDDRQQLNPVAFHHPNPAGRDVMRELLASTSRPANTNLLAQIVQGQALLVPTLTREQSRAMVSAQYSPYIEQYGIHSMLIVPLRIQGRVIGTLGVTRDTPGRPYTSADQVFLQSLGDHAALAIHNAQLFREVQTGRERLRQLTRQVVSVQEDERKRIARELHDEAGQALTALKIKLETAHADLPDDLESSRRDLNGIITLTDRTMEHIRLLAQDLRPPELEAVGLNPTLENYCEEFGERTRLQVFYSGADIPSLPDTVSIALYRVLQEALTNVTKHARADEVRVTLTLDDHQMTLSVRDDGQGFDTEAVLFDAYSARGFGLVGMRERLELLGGWLEVDSQSGEGTRLTAVVPWEERP